MVNIKTLLGITVLVLIVAAMGQASAAETCDCGIWGGSYTYNYAGNNGGVSGYCRATCSFGNAATGRAHDCCNCCCKDHSNYVGSCDIAPAPTTCSATDSDCSVRSILAGGFRFPFYTYFAGSGPAANGGAAAYCPKGTRGNADCNAACRKDTTYDSCFRCCNACCTPGVVSARAAAADDDDDDDLVAALRAVLRSRDHRQRDVRRN